MRKVPGAHSTGQWERQTGIHARAAEAAMLASLMVQEDFLPMVCLHPDPAPHAVPTHPHLLPHLIAGLCSGGPSPSPTPTPIRFVCPGGFHVPSANVTFYSEEQVNTGPCGAVV